jgi:hypothetical protein
VENDFCSKALRDLFSGNQDLHLATPACQFNFVRQQLPPDLASMNRQQPVGLVSIIFARG